MVDRSLVFETERLSVRRSAQPDYFHTDQTNDQWPMDLTSQEIPDSLLDDSFIAAIEAWLIARGQRTSCINGELRKIDVRQLDNLPVTEPQRIVSICPSNTECVAALGCADRLVALDSSSDFPENIRGLPRLGMDLDVDLNQLAKFSPDLVVASLSVPGMEKNVVALKRLGFSVVVLAPKSLDDVFDDMLYLGSILGVKNKAQQEVSNLRDRRSRIKRACSTSRPVRTYLEWWPKPYYAPGQSCWTNDLAELVSAKWIFSDRLGQSVAVNADEIIHADPELILVSWCGVPYHQLKPDKVSQRKGWGGINAIVNGHVYAVDEDLLGRPGPRLLDGALIIAEHCASVRQGLN